MAFLTLQKWYAKSGGYTAVTQWAALTAYGAGQIVRQLATPAVGSERCFACVIAGTSLASEPTWTVTQGSKTAESAGPTWIEITGKPGVNGDTVNSAVWLNVKNTSVSQGLLIYDSASASLQVCTTAGTAGNGAQPTFSATAGVVTSDGATLKWTSLGLASSFGAYAAPWARLNLVFATGFFVNTGDTVYASSNHSETQATTITYNANGTGSQATPINVLSVNDAVVPPTALLAGASLGTTGATSILIGAKYCYAYGLNCTAGSGSGSSATLFPAGTYQYFDTCIFALGNTNVGSFIQLSGGSVLYGLVCYNCNFVLAATGQQCLQNNGSGNGGVCIGGSWAATGSVPTTLFNLNNAANYLFRDVDFSAVIGTLVVPGFNGAADFQNCKLGSGVTLVSGTIANPYTFVKLHNCDSSGTNYRYFYAAGGGTVQQETTIVRAGGATNGVTPLSWNFTSNANANFSLPFQSEEISIWNNASNATETPTIYLTTNTTLNNNDFWIGVEYLASSSAPLGSNINTRMAWLGTPVALTTDSVSVWGGGITNKYLIQLPFTPQILGPIKVRIYLAKPSVTVYVDPNIYVTDVNNNLKSIGRSFFIPGWGYSNETAPSLFPANMVGGMDG